MADSTPGWRMPRLTSCSITMSCRASTKRCSSSTPDPFISRPPLPPSVLDGLVHEVPHLPLDELADEPRVGEVEPQRRQRHEPLAHGATIRARQVRGLLLGPADPGVRP